MTDAAPPPRTGWYARWGKRTFDLVVALPLLVLTLPVLVVVAASVGGLLGFPVLFRQKRPGLAGAPFTLYKFRSMTAAVGTDGRLAPDAERLTRFGRVLRSTSLDELPTLWNVVKGDMSLVGPRPLLMHYLPLYSPAQARRHEVRPGITGWAQVNGRNAVSWGRRFALDVWYVDHCGLGLDLRVLGLTLLRVVQRRDISAQGHVTMPEFRGGVDDE